MSGFLFWSQSAEVLADIGEEAGKLRWWQARTAAVVELLSRIRGTVDATGALAASR